MDEKTKEQSVRDNTKIKLAEEELRQSEEKYRLLIHNIQEGVFIIQDEKMQFVNPTFADITGYTIEEIIGKDFHSFVAPEDLEMVKDRYYRRQRGEDVTPEYEFHVQRKDGERTLVNMNAGIVTYRGRVASMGILRDITERKQVEESLKLFSKAVESAPDGIQIVDHEGHIKYSNKAVEKIYGFSHDELIGKNVGELNVDPEIAGKIIIPGIIEKGRWTGELEVRHKDGHEFLIWLTTSIVKDKTGVPIAMVGIIRDITERKQAEEAIRKNNLELEESNRMKELFMDIMHHDLLNPINVAHGYVELFLEDETNPLKKSHLETIKRNLVKGIELIDNAMKISKLDSKQNIEFEDTDLRTVVTVAIENFTQLGEKIKIENRLKGKMPAKANKIIEDVFTNLISNAIKYAPHSKKIVVDGKDGKSSWMVRVIDSGPGIKDNDKKLVFERFQRGDKLGIKGSGLGLAIARKIVELHKGRIWVEDNPEGGAIFVVEIPKS